MSARSEALDLAEEIKNLCENSGKPFSISVKAIAMQAAIFEWLNPELWEAALDDAREGVSLAKPEVLT